MVAITYMIHPHVMEITNGITIKRDEETNGKRAAEYYECKFPKRIREL